MMSPYSSILYLSFLHALVLGIKSETVITSANLARCRSSVCLNASSSSLARCRPAPAASSDSTWRMSALTCTCGDVFLL